MSAVRSCRVSIRSVDGLTHSVDVSGATLFEAAATAVAIFRQHAWAADALTANAILRVEVRLPSVVHGSR